MSSDKEMSGSETGSTQADLNQGLEFEEKPAADHRQNERSMDTEHLSGPPTSPQAQLHFLHWSSVFFDVLAHFRQFLFPILFAFWGARNQDWFWGILASIFFGVSILRTLFRYFTLQYGIFQGELLVKQGLFFRSVRTIPTRRIQNVDLRQNIVHRLLGVFEVHVETASGQEPEAILRVFTRNQVDRLRSEVFLARHGPAEGQQPLPEALTGHGPESTVAEALSPAPHLAPESVLLRVPSGWLAIAGLASDRGWIVVGVVVGLLYQFGSFESMDGRSVGRWIRQLIPFIPHDQQGYLYLAVWVLLGLIALKLFGMAWYLLRFHGYQLSRQGEDLRVSGGLLTTYSATIPRGRIQLISIQSSWLLRRFGMVRICVETAGGGGGEGEGDNQAQLMRSSFVPVVREQLVPVLLSELRPELNWQPDQWTWHAPARGTFRRIVRLNLLIAILVSSGFAVGLWPWGLGVLGLVVPLAIWRAWRMGQSLRYARTSFGVAFRSGILTKKLSLTFFERIQTLSLEQSPFDRRWKMATLRVDTAAAGPADHVIEVPYLEQPFADREFRELQRSAALHRPHWA